MHSIPADMPTALMFTKGHGIIWESKFWGGSLYYLMWSARLFLERRPSSRIYTYGCPRSRFLPCSSFMVSRTIIFRSPRSCENVGLVQHGISPVSRVWVFSQSFRGQDFRLHTPAMQNLRGTARRSCEKVKGFLAFFLTTKIILNGALEEQTNGFQVPFVCPLLS